MARSLPYSVFLEEFLIACAVSVKKSTTCHIEVDRAAGYVKANFDTSWPDSAMKVLCNSGRLRGSYTAGEPTLYSLTGEGLLSAEQLANARGENLDDLIETYCRPIAVDPINATGNVYNFPRQADSPVLSVQEEVRPAVLPLGPLIRLHSGAKEAGEDIRKTLEGIRDEHFHITTNRSAWPERLAQIEMGRHLLQVEYVYRGMLHFCLLAPLLWLLPKITDDDRQAEIQRLIDVAERLLQN